MAAKLLNLIALSSIAILACSFAPAQVHAVSVQSNHMARHISHAHDALAKRKRSTNLKKRCKSRAKPTASSSSTTPSSTPTKQAASSNNNSKPQAAEADPPANSGSGSTVPVSGGGGGGGNGKVGLAWPNGDDPTLAKFKTPSVGPLYTWGPELPKTAKGLGFNAIPMLWGDHQINDFKRLVVPGYADTVLGMNEPNQVGQSDMSPQHGAQLWKQYIQPLKAHGYKLISPATTSAPSGKQWMKDFFAACDGCTFDGLAIHYYDVTADGFIKYIEDFHNTFKLPIWPTEFACQNFNGGPQCSNDQVWSFMHTITKYMDGQDWVPHYFAFGAMHDMQGVNPLNQLMGANGPTALGSAYIKDSA